MAALFESGVSALLSNQRALATTSHNIANVNTPGFSRQRVNFSTREAQLDEGGFRGKGVKVASIERLVDQFATSALRTSTTNEANAASYLGYLEQLNNMLADSEAGVSPALSSLFGSLQDLSNDPSSVPVRDVVLDEIDGVVARFDGLDSRLADIESALNDGIQSSVDEINNLGSALATLNGQILLNGNVSTSGPPNDLLDQRDELIRELSALTRVTAVPDALGAVTVTIGTGQLLVSGTQANRLATTPSTFDASRLEVAYDFQGVTAEVSQVMKGGRLGALLDFRTDVLYPARNELGRTAVGLAQSLNAQHRQGMDLEGNLGGDLLSFGAPVVAGAVGNSGSVSLSYAAGGTAALTTADYRLSHDGTNFSLTNLQSGATATLSGAGPFTFDGMVLNVTTAPAAGDVYLLRPTYGAAGRLSNLVTRPADLAAAAPIRTARSSINTGTGTISAGSVTDVTNPALLTSTSLVFDSATTYRVNGAGASIAFTPGADINLNGWRVQISGAPRTGDTFTVSSNAGGRADNRNALLLVGVQSAEVLEGGTTSISDAYGNLVSSVGSQQRQSEVAHTALKTVLDRSVEVQKELSGVNLDEEAANLLRFQQAYQAAAQIIAAADTVFQALINATSR